MIISPGETEILIADHEFNARKLRAGPSQPKIRLARHSARSVARALVRMADTRSRERVLSVEGKLLVAANAIAPALVDRLLGKVLSGDDEGPEGETR